MSARILIVDDSRFQREMLRSILSRIPGATWAEAADGMEAQRTLAKGDFDIALVDLEMPGMNGAELARRIKLLRPHMAIGVVASAVGRDSVRQSLQGLADFCVAKPFAAAEIVAAIEKVIADTHVAAEIAVAPLTVLVADDSRTIRTMMAAFVADTMTVSHVVLQAEDGRSAARIVADAKPELVFLDINMPGGNGLQVLRFIREHNPSAFVVMVTDQSGQDIVSKVRTLGAQGYVLKPPTRDKVSAMVERFLKSR